jgi:hypothetical protein
MTRLADNTTVTTTRSKGFTLKGEAKKKVNLEVMMRQLSAYMKGEPKLVIDVPCFNILRTQRGEVYSKYSTKRHAEVMDKRVSIVGSYLTFPFGYLPEEGENVYYDNLLPVK